VDSKVNRNAYQSIKVHSCTSYYIPSKRYQKLQPEYRMTIASLLHQQYSLTQIATVLKCSPSNISRGLKLTIPKTTDTSARRPPPVPSSDADRAGRPRSRILRASCLVWCIIFWASAGRLCKLLSHWQASTPKAMIYACQPRPFTAAFMPNPLGSSRRN
jgi:hypothetical protein